MSEHPAAKVGQLLEGAWTASALAQFIEQGAHREVPEEDPCVGLLLKAGMLERTENGFVLVGHHELNGVEPVVVATLRSSLGQAYAIASGRGGWASYDEDVLLAQGIASSAGGRGFAQMIRSIPRLQEAFERGGVLLDVGVGVGALACAFCDAVPGAKVIGLDVLPKALELAARTVKERGLESRVDLRQTAVEYFDEESVADMAHMSPIFIPRAVIGEGIRRIARALKPGGWMVLSGIVIDGPDGVTQKWFAHHAGGTALTDADASSLAAQAGFIGPVVPPLPPGAPRVLLFQLPALG